MGNVFSNSYDIAELCLDVLQQEALPILLNHDFIPNFWDSQAIFGDILKRNKFFIDAVINLAPHIKQSYQKVNIKLNKPKPDIECYLAFIFTHYMIESLLNLQEEIVIDYDIIQANEQDGGYVFPPYNEAKIHRFKQQIMTVSLSIQDKFLKSGHCKSVKKLKEMFTMDSSSDVQVRFDLLTLTSSEKSLILTKLALAICDIIKQGNIATVLEGALRYFKEKEVAKSLNPNGLFTKKSLPLVSNEIPENDEGFYNIQSFS